MLCICTHLLAGGSSSGRQQQNGQSAAEAAATGQVTQQHEQHDTAPPDAGQQQEHVSPGSSTASAAVGTRAGFRAAAGSMTADDIPLAEAAAAEAARKRCEQMLTAGPAVVKYTMLTASICAHCT
jgi:hypothetical protein